MKNSLQYDYNGKAVEFLMEADLMINATKMGAIFGKNPNDFLKLKSTEKLLELMQGRPIGRANEEEALSIMNVIAELKPEKLVKGENGMPIYIELEGSKNIWMHRWLAIDYVTSLDLDFKLWMLDKIDFLLTNWAQKQRSLLALEADLRGKRARLLENNRNNPEVLKLAEIEDQLRKVKYKKMYETKQQFKNWNLDLMGD